MLPLYNCVVHIGLDEPHCEGNVRALHRAARGGVGGEAHEEAEGEGGASGDAREEEEDLVDLVGVFEEPRQ